MYLPWQNPSPPSSADADLKLLTANLAAKAVPRLLLRNGMLSGFATLASRGLNLQPSPVSQFLALGAGGTVQRGPGAGRDQDLSPP